jgi:hypothetical protein
MMGSAGHRQSRVSSTATCRRALWAWPIDIITSAHNVHTCHNAHTASCPQVDHGRLEGRALLPPATRKNRLSVVHDEHTARAFEIMGAGHSMLDSGGGIPPPKRYVGNNRIYRFSPLGIYHAGSLLGKRQHR